MKKITILKASDLYNYYEYNKFSNSVRNAEFQEVDDETFYSLKDNIDRINKEFRNSEDYDNTCYIIVECPDQEKIREDFIENISEFARRLENEKQIKNERKLAKKKKQLEKLKAELGEE